MRPRQARIGDLLTLERKPALIKATHEYTFLGISSNGGGFFRKAPVSGELVRPGSAFDVEPGAFVYSRLFAWQGSFEVATDVDAGCVVSGEFPTFRVDDDQLDARWLRYWLLSDSGRRAVDDRSAGSTPGSRNRLREDRFLEIPIPLLPIEEQRFAADRLGRVVERSAEIRTYLDSAAELSSALAASISTRRDLHDTVRANAGWQRAPLGRFLARSTRQVNVYAGEQYRIAGIYSFGRGLIDRGSISGTETSYKSLTVLDEGDVVVSKLNGWEGAVAVVDAAFAGHCVSSEFPTFKPDRTRLRSDFFRGIARSPWFWDALNVNTRGSMVRRRRINSSEFLATEVWLPTIGEQARLAYLLSTLDEGERLRSAATMRIEALVPAALNEAFTGLS